MGGASAPHETRLTHRLVAHLEKISSENAKVLIFVGTKRVADDLTKYLRQDGWPALAIHGDKQQQERCVASAFAGLTLQ